MMKKKICIITPSHWSYQMGGLEYQVKLLADHLSINKKLRIIYLAKKLNESYRPSGYDLIKISNENFLQKYGFFTDSLSLFMRLREIRPDIIYQRGGSAYTGIASYYAKMTNCRMIWHISSDSDLVDDHKWAIHLPHKLIEKNMLRWGIRNANVIVAQSLQQERIAKKINSKALIPLIRNFHPFPKESGSKSKFDKIIWVANIKQIKQPELFIKLLSKLHERRIRVEGLMVGAPAKFSNRYQSMIEALISNEENLQYLGELKIDKVNELISMSKLLVNTSQWEGFPNTFIQAWMRKTPVVSLRCDPDNIIKNFQFGLVSGTFANMLDDVAYLLENDRERELMGKKACNYASENHSLENLSQLKQIILD